MKIYTDHFNTFRPEGAAAGPELILLDIETTGFSPELSAIFMIGCGYFKDDRLETVQWLCDSPELHSEQEILTAFSAWLLEKQKNHSQLCIVTYNGQNFDIPFLNSRYSQCRLDNPLDRLSILNSSLDYYRLIRPYKHLWPPSDMKLKTLAEWLGFYPSKEAPRGRHLIKAYHEYIKTKDSDILNLLFLHNHEDIRSLAAILPLRHYIDFFNGCYSLENLTIHNKDQLLFLLKSKLPFPAPLKYEKNGFYIELENRSALLYAPLYPKGLRYYYRDIKNYVYLPEEDYVLHKSMASYVDKNSRVKATQDNCYTWFLPDAEFMKDRHRQQTYVEMIFYLFGFL